MLTSRCSKTLSFSPCNIFSHPLLCLFLSSSKGSLVFFQRFRSSFFLCFRRRSACPGVPVFSFSFVNAILPLFRVLFDSDPSTALCLYLKPSPSPRFHSRASPSTFFFFSEMYFSENAYFPAQERAGQRLLITSFLPLSLRSVFSLPERFGRYSPFFAACMSTFGPCIHVIRRGRALQFPSFPPLRRFSRVPFPFSPVGLFFFFFFFGFPVSRNLFIICFPFFLQFVFWFDVPLGAPSLFITVPCSPLQSL